MNIFSSNKTKLFIVIIVMLVCILFILLNFQERLNELRLVNDIQLWEYNFSGVNRISLHNNSFYYEFSTLNCYGGFDDIRTALNPFSRNGFEGNQTIRMRELDFFMRITYYINGNKLFSVGIYFSPENVELHRIEQRVTLFEEHKIIVVLDESGWFGGFSDSTLLYEILEFWYRYL